MHLVLIGTYPPTRCGIATFTADVEQALREVGVVVDVVVVDPDPDLAPLGLPSIVTDHRASYAAAADWLNSSDVDMVLVEHEFGIHGGEAGSWLLDLTQRLRIPYAVTLHTVLSSFTPSQSTVLEALCTGATAVTVFTPTARRLLLEQELAPSQVVAVVPHGAPVELYRESGRTLHDELGLDGCPVLSTFGLLSPGKGIEVAIRAMHRIVGVVPDARYVIAGRTHPGVQRTDGEHYRDELQRLVDDLGLHEHVTFVDRFLTVDEIAELLAETRVFVTPYRNADQIVSGALTFAIAAGCPVVSTPYRYALDMVGGGAGVIVPFDDHDAMADGALSLLRDGCVRTRAVAAAAERSARLSWPAVGRALFEVLVSSLDRADVRRRGGAAPAQVPASLHLGVLLDDTSVAQHAAHRLPRLEEGYCVDDTARLLPIAARLSRLDAPDGRWSASVPRLLAFLRFASLGGNGLMRNFMSWDRRWLDEPHDGDHVGRAIWGLGELIHEGVYVPEATAVLRSLIARPVESSWSRLVAYRALGLLAADGHLDVDAALRHVHRLVRAWTLPDRDGEAWAWPEDRVVYDAARIPEVMLRLGARFDDDELIERGARCLHWLERVCDDGDHARFPGHLGLGRGESLHASGDEQPIEATAMLDAAAALLEVTGDERGRVMSEHAWSWFLGNNRIGRPVGALDTGACHDALTADGVNLNCGAESTICYHRSADAIARVRASVAERSGSCSNVTSTTR